MAATIQPNTPSVAELSFVLFESTKLFKYTRDQTPPTRDTLQDAVVRILGIHTNRVSGAVCLDLDNVNESVQAKPTLIVCVDDPSFINYVKMAIALLQALARAAERSAWDSDAVRAAQAELITFILHHALSPHASEYGRLSDRLRRDLDTGLIFERDREDPNTNATARTRADVERYCEGLTYTLTMLNNLAPDMSNSRIEAVDRFWVWAKAQYTKLRFMPARRENVYAHVGKYTEISSALDLLTYMDHIAYAIVPPITALTIQDKSDLSSLTWLHNVTIKRLENSTLPHEISSFEYNSRRLAEWLFHLVNNSTNDAHIESQVLEMIIDLKTVDEKWARHIQHVNNASVHPELIHLIQFINTRLEAVSMPNDRGQQTHPSLRVVACTRTSCPLCVLCYEATRQAYGLEPAALYPYPTEGEITPHCCSPCRIPPLPPSVENKLKTLLLKEIQALVKSTIMKRTPRLPEPGEGGQGKVRVFDSSSSGQPLNGSNDDDR